MPEVNYFRLCFRFKMDTVVYFTLYYFTQSPLSLILKVMKTSVSAAHIAVVIICELIFYSCWLQHKLNIVSTLCSDSNVAYLEKSCRYELMSEIGSKVTNVTFMVCSFDLTKTHVKWIFYALTLKPIDSSRYLELYISFFTLHWKS